MTTEEITSEDKDQVLLAIANPGQQTAEITIFKRNGSDFNTLIQSLCTNKGEILFSGFGEIKMIDESIKDEYVEDTGLILVNSSETLWLCDRPDPANYNENITITHMALLRSALNREGACTYLAPLDAVTVTGTAIMMCSPKKVYLDFDHPFTEDIIRSLKAIYTNLQFFTPTEDNVVPLTKTRGTIQ